MPSRTTPWFPLLRFFLPLLLLVSGCASPRAQNDHLAGDTVVVPASPTYDHPAENILAVYHPVRDRPMEDVVAIHGSPGSRTVEDVLTVYGPAIEQRLLPFFQHAGVAYPPAHIALLGFKTEKRLEVWARQQQRWLFVRSYDVAAASGMAGPKLREGDYQVPEGIYNIEAFNPNSRYHLSMKLNYPNAFDRQQAAREGRVRLGGDIFIHGKALSAGCLAMGDMAIEELFVLVARLGMAHVSVLIAPYDFRQQAAPIEGKLPHWVSNLYSEMQRMLEQFRP